jgi:predicted negative regulator of RcsB-dependent stress response
MTEKLTKKDLKGPDEFVTSLGRSVEWTKENLRTVLLGAAAAVIVVVIVFGATGYRSWKERSATADLWPHINRVQEFLSSSEAGDREKLRMLDQALQLNMQKAPTSLASVYARYYLGSMAFDRGEYELAASRFRDGLAVGKGDDTLKTLLRLGLAQSLEGAGDCAGAIASYRDAMQGTAGGGLGIQAKLGQARCLEASGKSAEAAVVLKEILASDPPPGVRERVELSLSRVG